jgi:hypothetical protein
MNRYGRVSVLSIFAFLSMLSVAHAEPYLAVATGFKCVQCHANPTGGGLRNVFGNTYAQTQLAARRIAPEEEPWTGLIHRNVAIGGNLRANANWTGVPNQQDTNSFEVIDARAYLEASIIPNRLSLYFDERVAPGSAQNMEANIRLWVREGSFYVKAGRMFLPFGWRLEDDGAFVRQLSGVNMETPDQGVEIGVESEHWSAQLAVNNGSGTEPEDDEGKQVVASAAYVRSAWRLGASALFNDRDAGDRKGAALFTGARLGPVGLLAEVDYIEDDSLAPPGSERSELLAALVEGNWRLRQGHNLKLTYERFEPDRDIDDDEQTRSSLVYEYSPIQFLQLRVGVRVYDGIEQNDLQNREEAFVQLHGFF